MGAEPQIAPDQLPARRQPDPATLRDLSLAAQRDPAGKKASVPQVPAAHRGPVPPLAHPALAHHANAPLRAEAARRLQQRAGNRAAQHALGHARPAHPDGAHAAAPVPAHAEPLHAETAIAVEPARAAGETRLTDGQAHAALMGEWLSDSGANLVSEPILAIFDAPRILELRIPVQPASPKHPTAGGEPQAAIDETQAGYNRFLGVAGRYHGDVLDQANRILRSLDAAGEESLRQVEASLLGPLGSEMAALDGNRHRLEESIRTATVALNAQAAAARRHIDGTAFAARHRVDQAAAEAAARLPGVRNQFVQRFTTMYGDGAKEVVDSGTWAGAQLKGDEKKKQIAAHFEGDFGPDIAAKQEARRLAVPANLDASAVWRMNNGTALGQQIQARFTQTGAAGGQSLSQAIDSFIANLRMSIEGGEASGHHIESLREAGHKAVGRAESQALSALHQQIQAAQETLQHARTDGEAQLASQRSAAFARLSQIRHASMEGIRDTRTRAAQNLTSAANTALATYGDSATRLAQTLQTAAEHGPASLSETARQAFAGVAKALADGQKVQERRLTEVDEGARGNIRQTAAGVPLQAGEAAAELDRSLAEQINDLLTKVTAAVQQQTKGLTGMANGIAVAAASYLEQHAKACSQAVEKEKTNLEPTFQAEQGNISKVVIDEVAADKKTVDDPLPYFQSELDKAAEEVEKQCLAWAKAAKSAFGILTTNEEGLLDALRGHTHAQEQFIEYLYEVRLGGGNLRWRMAMDHAQAIGGLNDDQYKAALAYLEGDVVAGAKAELASTVHWYGGEGEHAENIMRSLTVEQRNELGEKVAKDVQDSLSGTDLKVFDALKQGADAHADALRLIDQMDAARRSGETEDQIKALRKYTGGATPEAAKQHLADVQREFASIQGIVNAQTGAPVNQEDAAKAFADYAVRDMQVEVPDEDGGTETYTMSLNKADAMLVRNAAQFGVDSTEGKAARVLHEAVRDDDKPNLEELERATVDPTLNPALTPHPTPEQLKKANAERDQIFQTAAALGGEFGFAKVSGPQAAKDLLTDKLRRQYDLEDEKGRVGADYVQSLVKNDVPDAAAGLRYAMLGLGTDEDLIHRNLQRLSRQDVEKVRADYQRSYGSDLYADLGVYPDSRVDSAFTFGELSGDDRLKAEVELMGVPQNDKEAAEVARYRQMQQRNETGLLGKALSWGSGEEEALSLSERRLKDVIGGKIETDAFGRPMIADSPEHPSNFDAQGKYKGPDRDAFTTEVNLAQTVAENYADQIDRITNVITTSIAILGAVVATVVTGGAGAPLLAMAIAGASGLLAMGASYAIKGGRYGWEQAITDLGMTVVQMVTAGVGQSLGAAAKVGEVAEVAEVAEGAGATAAKTAGVVESAGKSTVPGALEKLEQGGAKFGQMVKVGAATGVVSGAGSAALDEHTWDKGIGAGLGRVAMGGARGAFTGALSAAVTGGIERIPLGGSTLGEVLQSTTGPALSGGLLAGAGGMAGRFGEVGFDAATGRYRGNLHDALSSVSESGAQPFLQGFLEGAFRKPHAPEPDIHEKQRAAAAGAERQAPPRVAAPPAGDDPQRLATPEHQPQAPPAPVPAVPVVPEHAPPAQIPSEQIPEASLVGGGGGGGGRGPGAPPPPSGGEPLFPGLSDAEMDAAFRSMRSRLMVEVGTSEDIGLRIPKGQAATAADPSGYFGIDPATGMTVQEYSFLSKRGMPVLDPAGNPVVVPKGVVPATDSAGNPITGPQADKQTKLRLHSPHPNAPAGSASHEGWTINIEQGNARMTPDGKWFDTRYSTLPDGSRFDTRPYRRGPTGEWLDASSRPVTNPEHLAALNTWDRNMAASHIPVFPEMPPPAPTTPTQAPPTAPAPPRPVDPMPVLAPENTAAAIAGSRFRGDVVPLTSEGASGFGAANRNDVNRAIERLVSPEGPFASTASERPNQPQPEIELTAHNDDKVKVRIRTGETLEPGENGEIPVAEYVREGDGYTIRIARGAPSEAVERALAHELAEIRAVHPSEGSTREHALAPGATTKDLSPHDRGRLSELQVLARQFNEAPAESPKRYALQDEAERLAAHLGLTGDSPQANARLGRAVAALGEGPAGAFLENAAKTARSNPFLERLYGDPVHDLRVLNRRLEQVARMGGTQGERKARENQVLESAQRLVWSNELVFAYRKQPVARANLDIEALKPWLSPAEQQLLQKAVETAARPKIGEMDPAVQDPHTAAAVRTAFADQPKFQDWPTMRDAYFEGLAPQEIDPARVRWLFDEWASGRYVSEKGAPRSLFSEDLSPSAGFEAQFKSRDVSRPDLQLRDTDPVRVGDSQMTVREAVDLRAKSLREAQSVRAQLDLARRNGDPEPVLQGYRDQLTAKMRPANNISEAVGVAAGRAFLVERFGAEFVKGGMNPKAGFVEIPRAGSGVPDLVYKLPDGRLIVVECKGGESGLGTRLTADKASRAEQGHIEYLRSLAEEMAKSSTNSDIRKLGQDLLVALIVGPTPEYWKVQQPIDPKTGLGAPLISQFALPERRAQTAAVLVAEPETTQVRIAEPARIAVPETPSDSDALEQEEDGDTNPPRRYNSLKRDDQ